tara:strand:- start:759 stop:1220 length:462 start_codon:yes stop_codon:yes gene_type:complete
VVAVIQKGRSVAANEKIDQLIMQAKLRSAGSSDYESMLVERGLSSQDLLDLAMGTTGGGPSGGALKGIKRMLGMLKSKWKFPHSSSGPQVPTEVKPLKRAAEQVGLKPKGMRQFGKFNRQLHSPGAQNPVEPAIDEETLMKLYRMYKQGNIKL